MLEISHFYQLLPALKNSPLFNLSLSSKELFHSNFLAWLCELYPAEAGAIFANFLPHPVASFEQLKVYRERHNIDLTLEYRNGDYLLIENKVKSLPYLAQLEQYAAAVKDKTRTGFLLLSLTEPPFLDKASQTIKLKDNTTWAFLGYDKLAKSLASVQPQIATRNHYHGQLLQDYLTFIQDLSALSHLFEVRPDDNGSNFFGNYQEIEQLNDLRLADFVHKLRYSQLAAGVAQRLESEGFEVLFGGGSWWGGKAGQLSVSSDMSRGTAFFDLKYVLTDENSPTGLSMVGIQLQGNAFRLVFEYYKDKNRAAKMAEALLLADSMSQLWFDLSLIKDNKVEYPKKGGFNQYSGTFFYRYKLLGAQSPYELINLIVEYARLMRKNALPIVNEIIRI
jgi:hypothetical protein